MARPKPYPDEMRVIKVPRFNEEAGYYTTIQRSNIMSKIKGKNSKPELFLRKRLWANKIRYRIHPKNVVGNPDIIISKYKLIIFVDGDFWHGYQWEIKKNKLRHNREFWIAKIERNIQRDRYIDQYLISRGFTVMRFWEHQIKKDIDACINQIQLYIEAARNLNIPASDQFVS